MEFLGELWIPIVASAVLIFVVSSIVHMCLPIHCGDHAKLPDEEALMAAMRGQGLQSGSYMFPRSESMKDMCSPEMREKQTQGPSGYLTVLPPGPPAIGKSLVHWFLYTLVVGVFVAYLSHLALRGTVEFMRVFQFTGAAAFMAYGVASVVDSIWKGQSWGTSCKFVFDGLLYSLSTGACFAWLWPAMI